MAQAPPPAPDGSTPASDAPLEERVLHQLKLQVTPLLPADLATALKAEEKVLKRLLGKMARDGSVRRAGGGRFTTSRHYR